jgi:hypothetical protein
MGRTQRQVRRQRVNTPAWLAGAAVLVLAIGTICLLTGLFDSRAVAESQPTAPLQAPPAYFDHDATAFPLVGAHRFLKCEQCHLSGQYKTLPTRCDECHTGQLIYGKPNNHVLTSQNCNACHTQTDWTFHHDLVGGSGQQCSTCHNGQTAEGKPTNHIPTTSDCSFCHNTRAWSPTTFKHDASVAGQCSNCHNGQIAEGKPAGHFGTTLQCDVCHSTSRWTPISLTFHAPTLLIGAHAGLDCSDCHVISTGAVIYRDGTTYGSCANCHTRDYPYPHEGHSGISQNANCLNCHSYSVFRGD